MPGLSTTRRPGWLLCLILLLMQMPKAHAQSTLSIPAFTVSGILQAVGPTSMRLDTNEGQVTLPTKQTQIAWNGSVMPLSGPMPFGLPVTVTAPATPGTLMSVRSDDHECVINGTYGMVVCPLADLPLSTRAESVPIMVNGTQQLLPLSAAASLLSTDQASLGLPTMAYAGFLSRPGDLALPPLTSQV
ncbi:MAG: hypothetical protein ACYCW6_04690 [Candidatus Xenobia bacterium]